MTVELQIAVATPLHQTFTYSHVEALAAGVRVLVPFGSQPKTLGVVMPKAADAPAAPKTDAKGKPFRIKPINAVLDKDPVYSPNLMQLGQWMANYYMHPIGEVLRTMLPASSKKSTKVTYELTLAGAAVSDDVTLQPLKFFSRKKTITEPTLKKKCKDQGLSPSQTEDLIKDWLRKGWIDVAREKKINTRQTSSVVISDKSPDQSSESLFKQLNTHQETAVSAIIENGLSASDPKSRKPFLLFGVTGSGKTEVFLNVIRAAIAQAKTAGEKAQTLVLVPEISLTPQMTRIFEERFPGRVAVVHSAMDDDERWQELDRVRRGEASVLIGPRSAVFGPFANLKLIIVDEEHDGSYKQGSGLLYNARDVAIVRAGLEGATVVLGSATPSMESWHNAETGKYHLLSMPERASTKPLPEVETIPSKPPFKAVSLVRGDVIDEKDSPFSEQVIAALKDNLAKGQQSIVLVNRRGYAYYLLNVEDRKAAGCPHCSISLSVHGRRKTLRCHYCDYTTTIQNIIDENPTKTWAVVGYGSQKAEDHLKAAIPQARIARVDSDTVQNPHVLPEILGKFRQGELDILVGTQILAKGHDFPNVTLIAILEVDQLLGLPDFRGGERTFQLLVQAAGRSGRGSLAGKVMVQSLRASHPVVQKALQQDFPMFAKDELAFRKAMGYPPFGRMVLFEFNGTDARKLDHWCAELEGALADLLDRQPELARSVKVLGPAPAPIEVIRGRVRRSIIILSSSLRDARALAGQLAQLAAKPPGDIRVKIDVDPQATL